MRSISLNLLRTLECVIRHMSFIKAAEELCVSPSAVSQQIKRLEEQLNVELFRRVSNKLIMTDACVVCAGPLQEALRLLLQIPERLETLRRGSALRLSVAPSFASRWLIPRLDRFRTCTAEIDLWINVSTELVDFTRGDADLALRYGKGKYPNLHTELLVKEAVFPVCSPSIVPTGRIITPADLPDFVLLHDDSTEADPSCPDWKSWFESAGITSIDWSRGLHFNQSNLVLEAAAAGKGVALAKGMLAADDIASARLIKLFGWAVVVESAYYLVCPAANAKIPAVQAFRTWIRSELAGEQ